MELVLKNCLAKCRADKKISKSQLAFRLQKSRSYVTRLERGDIGASLEVALLIARYFGKPVEEIFTLAHESSSSTSFGTVGEQTTMPKVRK